MVDSTKRKPDFETKKEEEKTVAFKKEAEAVEEIVWREGEVIYGLYEIRRKLGAGGMGEVWLIHHLKWNIDLAMKSPLPELVEEPEARERFIREAESWVDLEKHPNIATCFYVREIAGFPRIFVEYIDGGNLEDWIQKGRVEDWKTILRIAIEIAYGMAHAHSKGLVHRDLKPTNILLTKEGDVKITDFGLVRRLSEQEVMSEGWKQAWSGETFIKAGIWRSMTVSGGCLGTPAYMPPEQWIEPHKARKEADVYAFGVILFEMIAKRKPYEIPDEFKAAVDEFKISLFKRMHCTYPIPDVREYRKDCPESLSRLITKCLQKEPKDRYHDFETIARELMEIYEEVIEESYSMPKIDELKLKADDLNNKAVSLLELGKKERAKKLFEEALRADPHHLIATFNLGLLQWREGEISDEEFIKQLEDVVLSQSSYGNYLLGLAYLELGDLEFALEYLRKAARFQYVPDFHNALGLAHFGMRNYEESTRCFGKAVELDPSNWRYRFNLAASLLKEGKEERAKEQLLLTLSNRRGILGISSLLGVPPTGEVKDIIPLLHLLEVPSARLLRTLDENDRFVSPLSFSPDRRFVLSGSNVDDTSIRLWDIKTGECIRTFRGHEEPVLSVCFSPDGRYALSGGEDETIRLWDIETGECIRIFEDEGSVKALAFSPDGRFALSGSSYNTIRLWDIETGKCIRTFEGHQEEVESVAFSPDGKLILSGSYDDTIRLWDIKTGRCLRVFVGHQEGVNSVCFSPDGRYVLSGSSDNTIRLWDIETGKCIRTFEGHQEEVESVAFSPDGRFIISGSGYFAGVIKLWDVKTGGCLRTFFEHEGPVFLVCFSPDGRYALSGSFDNTIRLWDISAITGGILRLNSPLDFRLTIVTTVAEDMEIASKVKNLLEEVDRLVQLEEYRQAYKIIKEIRKYPRYKRSSEILGLTTELGNKYGRRRGLRDAWLLRTFEGHQESVNSVCFSPDGRYVLSGSGSIYYRRDCTLRLWDCKTGRCIKIFEGHEGPVTSVCFWSPSYYTSSRFVLSGSEDGTVRLWDIETGECIRTFEGHESYVTSVSFSPDGRFILSGSDDRTLRLWDCKTGRCIKIFEGHEGPVTSVCFSPDGMFVLSGSADGTVRLWDIETGRCLKVFELYMIVIGIRGERSFNSVCFSPDGRYVLAGGGDKTLRLWELDWEWEF